MSDYDFHDIETRWQKRWADAGAFEVAEDPKRPKFYCLEMLPYPSGDIHVGHVRNYCITDVISRCKTMRGFNVMHPIGWDALGLPAENAAIKRGIHPEKWTRENIASMKRQLQRLGLQLPLEPRDRDLRRRVLPLEPVDLPAHARAGDRLPRQGPGQLVPVVPHRARQRAGRGRDLLALQEPGRAARHGAVVPPHHRLPGPAPRRHAAAHGVAGARPRAAEELGGEVARRGDGLPGRGPCADPRLHDPGRHDLRRDLHGARPRAPDGGRAPRRPPRRRGAQGQGRPPPGPGPPRAARGQGREGGRLHRAPRHEPLHRREDPGLGGQLRPHGLRHGGDHVRPRPRPARLRVRPEVRDRGAGRHPAGGRDARRRDDGGRVRRAGPGREQRGVRRPRAPTRRSRGWPPTPQAKGFGKATITYRLKDWLISRQRYWGTPIPVVYCEKDGMQPVPDAELPVVLPPDAPFTGEGGNPLEKVAGVRERHLPEVRREGPARDGHHGHLRGLVLVLLPLPLAPEDRRALRRGGREVLVPDRPLRRRDRARHPPPRLLALLDEGDARPRPRRDRRAGDAALPAGDGPQGRRGDVEVEGQHDRPRRRDRPLRGGHPAALHPLRRPARARDGVERERHRGAAPLPPAGLAARGPSRGGPRRRAARERRRRAPAGGAGPAPQGAPDDRQGHPRRRGAHPAQHGGRRPHGAQERDPPPRGGGRGRPGPRGAARGPRDARAPPQPLHPARVRGDVGPPRPRGRPRPRRLARLRRGGRARGRRSSWPSR